MTAPEPADNERPEDLAEFSFSRRPVKGRRYLTVAYRDIKLSMSWVESEDGAKALANFAEAFPKLIKAVLREMLVRSETDDLDATIERLLGDDK